jgi:hypothetical protein
MATISVLLAVSSGKYRDYWWRDVHTDVRETLLVTARAHVEDRHRI